MTAPNGTRALAEQPEDWTEPGAHAVVPGVVRIPLPMPDTGLKAVNVYLIDDGDGITLVDSGWDIPAVHRALAPALHSVGATSGDIREFLITHAHHDHLTAALAVRSTHGCSVRLGRGERASLDAYRQLRHEHDIAPVTTGIAQADLLRRHGADELATAFLAIRNHELAIDDAHWELPDVWIDDGDVIDLGRRGLEAVTTPGHTRGHVVFRDKRQGLLFAGDHVLPHITPSIGFETCPERLPLRSYLDSLRLVRHRADVLLLPAHGPVLKSAHARVDELLRHHDTRFEQILDRVDTGDATAHDVASNLLWTGRGRPFSMLDELNQCLAVMETGAHLDVLALDGRVHVRDEHGIRRYESRTAA